MKDKQNEFLPLADKPKEGRVFQPDDFRGNKENAAKVFMPANSKNKENQEADSKLKIPSATELDSIRLSDVIKRILDTEYNSGQILSRAFFMEVITEYDRDLPKEKKLRNHPDFNKKIFPELVLAVADYIGRKKYNLDKEVIKGQKKQIIMASGEKGESISEKQAEVSKENTSENRGNHKNKSTGTTYVGKVGDYYNDKESK